MIPFVDCQGLAGGLTLGAVQSGFDLVHRASVKGGFGDHTIHANRHLVGDSWSQDPGESWDEWEPAEAALLAGTPPCSAFSSLSTRGETGPGSRINRCMWELVNYASRCPGSDGRPGPEIVMFESVQGAFLRGRALMRALWDRLDDETGQSYELHNVLMSGASVGAAQLRHRYFCVLSRVPFGVDPPARDDLPGERVVTYGDAISDLVGARVQWASQPYPDLSPSEYASPLRSQQGAFDCHMTAGGGLSVAVTEAAERGWRPGTFLSEAFDELGYHPEQLAHLRDSDPEKLRRGKSSYRGLNWPLRVDPTTPGYVIAGTGARDFAHWEEPRLLTIRELSRLMGYPDDWAWQRKSTVSSAEIGKCAPVPSCRWITGWCRRALEGDRGAEGRMIADGEYLYDFTALYKDWL